MKTFFLTSVLTLCVTLTSLAQAQTIPLTVDSAQSSVAISIADFSGSSQLSGGASLDLESSNPPSGIAQITDLNLVLDNGLNFGFALVVSGSTLPGDVTISMVTPGSPGTISSNSFGQLGNSLELGGQLTVLDPFGVAGGNQAIDLSAITISPLDFTSIDVTQSGNVITISSAFTINESATLANGGDLPVIIDGTFVASGEVPTPVVLLGDVNIDGTVDCFDISPFITFLFTREFQTEADVDQSGAVNFGDILPFVTILFGP